MKKILAIICAIAMICSLALVASADESYTAALGFANSDWSTQEWGDNVNTTVTGAGTYTLSFDGAASDALVFVIDIKGANEGITAAGLELSALTVTVDGVDVPVDLSKVVTGDIEENGNWRIEIYNEYGSTKENPPVDPTAVTFATNLTISFTLTDPNAPVEEEEEEEKVEEETEVTYKEVTVENVLDVAVPTGSGWQQAETMTTLWGGTLDSGFIAEDGALKIYFTANAEDLWQIRVALNGSTWAEIDWHVDPTQVANPLGVLTDNGDGTFVVTFNYDDLVAVYGTDDFAGTLGAIYICTNAGSDVTVTKVAYETTELVPDTSNAKTADASHLGLAAAAMLIAACGVVVVAKKKEF